MVLSILPPVAPGLRYALAKFYRITGLTMSEQRISKNKYVEFTYQITEENGDLIEQVSMPVGYAYGGAQQMFDAVEAALEDMQAGEKASVTLAAGEAYGDHDPALTFTDDLSNVPPQFQKIGAQVEMQNENGESKVFVVSAIDDKTITVDGNHPMAGKKVIFNITVLSVRDATIEEINGQVSQPEPQLH